jgi:hydrogenase small subunit
MYLPSSHPWSAGQTLGEHLERTGVSRRDFLTFCSSLAAMLGLDSLGGTRIARALQAVKRPPVIWLQLQECTGCVESVLRTEAPTIGDLVLDLISLDYQHTIMAAAGHQAEAALAESLRANAGQYVLLVTGSVPLAENGIYTTIGGRTAKEVLEEAARGAAAILAVGACAHWGSVQAAHPNPTRAVGVGAVIRNKPVVNIAGCPPIADVVTATVVHYLTFARLPALDAQGRPLFAYGARIHDQCPRRANFDAGQFVERFDDAAARRGWCLYKVGCKGPATFSPCPIVLWNSRAGWPIGAGHPCLGCTEPQFWDQMTPFYDRLPDVTGYGWARNVDLLGAALAVGAAGGVAAHAVVTGINQIRARKRGRELPIHPGGGAAPAPEEPPVPRGEE